MIIVDLIYSQWVESEWSLEIQKTLFTCSLVCKEWCDHVQWYLSWYIAVPYEGLSSLSQSLERNQHIFSSTPGLRIVKTYERASLLSFVMRHPVQKLCNLIIERLDLARESPLLNRSPLFGSIRYLGIYYLQPCKLSQLVRFINSFPSISQLELSLAFDKLEHRGQILPKPLRADVRSLTWLWLDLIPGVSMLIDWLLKAKPLLANLKTLILYTWNIEDEDDFTSSFDGVDRLLDSCRSSVQDIRLYLESIPFAESISDLCEYSLFRFRFELHSYMLPVKIDLFPRLGSLTYGCYGRDTILPYAVRQLETITSTCDLTSVYLDLSSNWLDRDLARRLDTLLVGPRFPYLCTVVLQETVSFDLFPELEYEGRLMVLEESFWKDPPFEGKLDEHGDCNGAEGASDSDDVADISD